MASNYQYIEVRQTNPIKRQRPGRKGKNKGGHGKQRIFLAQTDHLFLCTRVHGGRTDANINTIFARQAVSSGQSAGGSRSDMHWKHRKLFV